ncbi:hypothetical protein NMG60_11005340 [Bertholletia excelsa]
MNPNMDMPGTHDTMNMNDMTMHMTFYWGKNAVILFEGWPNSSLSMYVLSLFFVFVLSAAVEVLSVPPEAIRPWKSPAAGGLAQGAVHALRTALAYMVMLSVMSFNLGIFIAAVAGHAVGYFVVKWRALAVEAREETTAGSGSPPKV